MAAYARQAAARSSAAFTISGRAVTLAATVSFPAMVSGAGGTVTHVGFGSAVSGAAHLTGYGTLTPNIAVANGIMPKLSTGSTITVATAGLSTEAATAFLTLLFNNSAWTFVGDAAGLLPSAAAGSFFLSLHTSSPGDAGSQTTNEISYS